MKKTPSAKQLAAEAIRLLKASTDEQYAKGVRTYFKKYEEVKFFGVRTPQVRKVERALFLRVRGEWDVSDAVAFCDLLIQQPQLEAKFLGLLLLSRYRKHYGRSMLRQMKSWLRKGYCDNWATTDALCSLFAGFLVLKHPELVGELEQWTRDKRLYLRRTAAVALLPSVRKGRQLDAAYRVAEALFDDREDLIHKATGWLLREAGKKDARRLEKFLLEHGPRIPRTAVRYAIERFPEAKRKKILTRTRAQKAD